MPQFDLNKYETVEDRLEKFWSEHPEGRIFTQLISDPCQLDECVVRAEIYFSHEETHPRGTGMAFERRGSGGANNTAHLENAETSSIGRALANAGYKARKDAPRPSREEMQKANGGGYQGRPANAGQQRTQQSVQGAEKSNAYAFETGARQQDPPAQEPEELTLDGGAGLFCANDECAASLTPGQHALSLKNFGRAFCPRCQKTQQRAA